MPTSNPFSDIEVSLDGVRGEASPGATGGNPFSDIDVDLSAVRTALPADGAVPSVQAGDRKNPFSDIQPVAPRAPERRAPGFLGPIDATPGFGVSGPAIPGLSISGGQLTSLPESLPTEAPPALLANPGKLSRDQLNRELRVASAKYSRTRDMGEKVQILAEFIRAWDPEKADSLGITRDGYIEPTGFWKVLDVVDIVFDRWLRVGGETLWEGKQQKAAALLAGEKPETDLAALFKRNWEEDKGQLSKGSEGIKSWTLWATTPWGFESGDEAIELFEAEAGYDIAESDFADFLSASTHEVAGLLKRRPEYETHQIIEEAKAQGSPGAHMALDLAGFMSVSSLNLLGLGPFRGAMGGVKAAPSTRRLMGLGIKTNPLADLRMGDLEISSMSQARKGFVEDLAKTAEAQTVGARVSSGRRAAAQASIDATADQVASLTKIADELTGVERGLVTIRSRHVDLLGKTDDVSVAKMEAMARESARLGAKYDTLMTQFDESFNALAKIKGAGRIPGKDLFGGIQARAATIVGKEVMDATDLALKHGIKSGAVGSRSVPLLSEAKEFARAEGLNVFEAEAAWVEAMRAGEKSKKVLVDLGLTPTKLGDDGKMVKGVASNPTFLSPGEARVYENARNGVHGPKAKVAAHYPSTGVLQKTMGSKKFAHLAAEATDEIIAISAGKGYRSAGRRAVVKGIQKAKGMSKAEIAFQADRIVTNVRPMGFALAHAIAKKFPWAERIRRPLAGIASLTHRPMTYATKGPDGKWAAIEPNLLMHPVLHRRMAAEERQRLTSIAKLRSAWPVWKAQLENMAGGNEELLDVGRFAYEIGWASEETAMATLKDVNKLAAVETVNNFINKVSLAGKALKAGEGRTVQVLGADEVQQIGESLKFLRENTGLEGRFFDDIEKLASDYVSASRGVEADVAVLGIESVAAKARAGFLEDLRLQASVLYSAAHASLERRLGFQAEQAVAELGSEFAPELKELSKKLAGIDAQLAARKSAAVQTDASKQLDEAIAALSGVTKEDILRSRDVHADAYRGSLEDFRRSVAAEFGDEVGDEAMRQNPLRYFSEEALRSAARQGSGYKSREVFVYLTPDEFLSMAKEVGRPSPSKTKAVNEAIDEGKKLADIPYLMIKDDGVVIGHEGRHRALALKSRGEEKMPVLIRADGIRWSEQKDAALFDYEKVLPARLQGQGKPGVFMDAPWHLDGPRRGEVLEGRAVSADEAMRGAEAVEDVLRAGASAEKKAEVFHRLAGMQRRGPEDAMRVVVEIAPLSAYAYLVEHVGDLINRMSKEHKYLEIKGYPGDVDTKVRGSLSILREIREGLEDVDVERFREAARAYANEHAKLPTYNEVQRLSNDAAVAVGEFRFGEAEAALAKLKTYLDESGEAWSARVTKVEPAHFKEALTPPAAARPPLTPPAAAAEAAGRRGAMSVEDVAQSYSQSVRAAWNNGDDVSIRSLFEASWDPVNNKIDATLLGAVSVSGLKLPKGVQGAIEKLGKARRAIDEATVSLRVAEDIEAGVIGEKTAAAQKALVGARSKFNSLLERASETVSRDPLFVRGQGNLLHEVGSDQRRILEAIQLHYRGRIASITSQVATEASVIRERSRKAMTSLADKLRSVRPRIITQSQEDKLRDALKQLGDSIFGRDISVKLPAGKDVSADILLKRAVVKARKIKDPAKRAAVLHDEIKKVIAKLAKVGDAISESDLGKAVAALDARRVSKKGRLPTEQSAFEQAIADHVNKFLKAVDDSTFDLRHPDDILRPIEDRITAHYNNAEAARAVFNAKIKILKDADLAKLIPSLSADEAARISKLVKNPLLHNLIDGPERLLGKFQSQLASARKKLARYEGEGVDAAVIEKQRKNIASLEEKIRIMGDPEDFDRVLGVARIMKDFFDEHLRGLKEAGVLDDTFDADEFFSRVDVGAYFPHILSQAAKKKLDAFGVGTGGRVGRSIVNYFSQNRKMAGVVEDINEFRKGADAEKILVHAAKNGQYGEGAAQAAVGGKEALKSFFKKSGQSFDDFVEEIKEGALMAEYNGLFETDPLVVMEYYHMKASEAVADARFIDTSLDLFPAGRLIAEIADAAERRRVADQMGYVPLGEVEHLESILKKRLPKGLRGLSKELKVRVINGASMDEIEALVRAEIGQDIPRDVLTALSDPKMKIPYVPIQIKEYLNWRNSTDAFLAKKSMGTEVWDGMQAWAKAQATIVALAHIGRNFIGNTISLLQEIGFAALNPSTQITAMRIWGSWGDDSLDALVKIGSHEMTVRDWRDFFSSRGFFDEALSTDFLEESVGFAAKQVPSNQQLAAQLTGTGLGAVGGGALASLIPGMMPLGVFAGGALGLKAAKRWSGVKAVRGGSAYQRFIKDTGKEIKETPRTGIARGGNILTAAVGGGIVGSTAPAMALPMAALSVNSVEDYLQMMSGLNRAAESQARLSMAVGLMKRGVAPDEALIRVNRSLRDYSDLTPIEKNVFRRFFFFYTWEAGNIKYQLNWMKRNPATARGLAAFTNGVYQMQFTEEQLAEIPEHYRYGVVVKSGAAKLIAVSGLPWQPMIEVLTRSKDGMPMQGMMTRINPAILTTMEMFGGGGRSFYYGRPIKELNNINQLKKGPPMLKMIFGYPEEPNYYAPVYKNGVKTGRTRAVRKSTAPVTYYLAQKMPGWRWMNQYMILSAETFNSYALESALTPEEVEDARAEWYERVAMFGFGFKETMIDWDYEGYRIRKELNERMLDMINNQYPMAVGERRYLRRQLSVEPNPPPQMELEE